METINHDTGDEEINGSDNPSQPNGSWSSLNPATIIILAVAGWILFVAVTFKLVQTRNELSDTSLSLLSLRQEIARLRLLERDIEDLNRRHRHLSMLIQGVTDESYEQYSDSMEKMQEHPGPYIPREDTDETHIDLQRTNPIPHLWPVAGWITQEFRPEATQERPRHLGIDIAGRTGSSIIAPANGIVLRVYWDDRLGRVLELQHSEGHITRYGHLQEVELRPGDFVQAGDLIARLGNSGQSTAPHLHYEIEIEGNLVDPGDYLPGYRKSSPVLP